MSDELRLPDELAACEARLAARLLPASGIDRDQLMYRAGWAAGAETARLAGVNSPPLKGGARGGITAAWSLTSAAVAASLAVMLTLQWRSAEKPNVADNSRDSHPPLAAGVAEASRRDRPPVAVGMPTVPRFDTGLIALRQRAMANVWAEPTNVTLTTGDSGATAAKTARELMQELLPGDGSRPTTAWPWTKHTIGESI